MPRLDGVLIYPVGQKVEVRLVLTPGVSGVTIGSLREAHRFEDTSRCRWRKCVTQVSETLTWAIPRTNLCIISLEAL